MPIKPPYQKRLGRALALLAQEKAPAALLLSSAPEQIRTQDLYYPYRPDSDFFYFTGSASKNCALLLSTRHNRPLLFEQPQDPSSVLWMGARPSLKKQAAALGAEYIAATDLLPEIRQRLKGSAILYFQNSPGSLSQSVTQWLLAAAPAQRPTYPRSLHLSELLTKQLRLIKDRTEQSAIQAAIAVTHEALTEILPLLRRGTKEAELAAALSYGFARRGAREAFPSIVAAGRSAATLHYEAHSRKLDTRDLLLIDCGAELNGYAADISRSFPVSRSFSPWQRELYQIVWEAQTAAIGKVRAGVKIHVVYQAAARVLTQGLVELKVLRGKVSDLLQRQAYQPYFPHSIGHSLGLDVHDIGGPRRDFDFVLQPGMVLTIEPGLYFSRPTRYLPAGGVRIEDNLVVTTDGSRILSRAIPQAPAAVEHWLGS